jgi:hypothetical protein
MRLITARADLVTLTASQSWENYCTALHLSLVTKSKWDKAVMSAIACQSLDVYFARLEARREARAALAGGKWEPWG